MFPIDSIFLLGVLGLDCSGMSMPMQPILQGGKYILNCSFPLSISIGGEAWGPPKQVDTLVDIPDLLLGHMVSYHLHSRLVCLRVRFTHATMAALAEHSFCLFLPSFGSMQEHFMEDHQPVGVPSSHWGYLSRKSSTSNLCLDSLIESPLSPAHSQAILLLLTLPHTAAPTGSSN